MKTKAAVLGYSNSNNLGDFIQSIAASQWISSKEVLSIDPAYFRPTEVDLLIGDPTKAREELGWIPEHDLSSLVKDMIKSDVKLMQKQQY